MPPRRSSTPTKGSATAVTAAPVFSFDNVAADGGSKQRASGRKSSSTAPPAAGVDAAEVQRLINEALAKARAERHVAPLQRRSSTPSSVRNAQSKPAAADAADGEADTAPEEGNVARGFFSGADRVYSRKTTQCLTDLAGFLLLVFLAFYFTLSGYWFYQEFSKSYADGSALS